MLDQDSMQSRYRSNLVNFWSSNTISAAGSQISMLALPLIALTMLNAEGWQIGLLAGLQYAPNVLLSLHIGRIIDRWPLRGSLIAANLAAGVTVAAVTVLYLLQRLELTGLCVVAFILGTLRLFIELGNWGYGPVIFMKDRLVQANSRVNAGSSVAETAGPGLAGLLIDAVKAPFAVVVDALSFFLAAAFLRATTPLPRDTPPADHRLGLLAGFRILFATRQLRVLALTSACFNVCLRAAVVSFTIYAVRELSFTPSALGICLAVGSAGGIVGAAAAHALSRRLGVVASICVGIALASAGMFAVPWGFGPLAGFTVAGLGLFTQWLGLGIYNVHVIAYRQTVAPAEAIGRVTASYRMISHGCVPLGALAGGTLTGLLGARATLALAGAVALTGAGLAVRGLWSYLRQPSPEPV